MKLFERVERKSQAKEDEELEERLRWSEAPTSALRLMCSSIDELEEVARLDLSRSGWFAFKRETISNLSFRKSNSLPSIFQYQSLTKTETKTTKASACDTEKNNETD